MKLGNNKTIWLTYLFFGLLLSLVLVISLHLLIFYEKNYFLITIPVLFLTFVLATVINKFSKLKLFHINSIKSLSHTIAEASKAAQIGFWEYNSSTKKIYLSEEGYNILGIEKSNQKLSLKQLLSYIAKEDLKYLIRKLKVSIKKNKKFFITIKIITEKKEIKYVEVRGKHFLSRSNLLNKSVGSIYDITTKYYSEKKFQDLLANASDGIHILDLQGNVIECSHSFAKTLGYSYEEAKKLNVADWDAMIPKIKLLKAIAELIKSPRAFETKHKLKDGSIIDVQINAKGILLDGKQYLYASQRDITALKKAEEKLSRLALYDVVTGVANRVNFLTELPKSIARAKRNNTIIAVFFIDLDNFKLINDKYGHHIGDLLLKAIAKRLSKAFRSEDRLARIGGDEFAAIAENINSIDEVKQVAKRCIDVTSRAFNILDASFNQYFSIGISLFPDSAQTADKLLQCADTAMYRAKEEGKNSMAFYHKELDTRIRRNNQIENALRQAIARNELSLEYQPQYSDLNEIFGIEALLRWNNHDITNLTPDEFIPIAEKSRSIIIIGQWAISKAFDDWELLNEKYRNIELQLSINISSVQLYHPSFVSELKELISRKKFNPSLLTLEITETHLIEDIEQANKILLKFSKHGIKIALDDFGTGYSSLNYLANLPISYLKIDKGFVLNSDRTSNQVIIKLIISLAKNLNTECIAEGVETIDQLNFLREVGCNKYQGFYFSKPKSIDKIDLNNLSR